MKGVDGRDRLGCVIAYLRCVYTGVGRQPL